jgi:membrane protein YdbS with pleckstrin-like domain
MSTTIQSSATYTAKAEKVKSNSTIWEQAEFNRFGVIAFVLSIVAFFVDMTNQLEITMIVAPTMLTLCSILIVAPMRWIVGIGIAALVVDLLMVLF